MQPNIAVTQPSQAESQVGSKSSTQQGKFGLTLSASSVIGLKRSLTTSHTQSLDRGIAGSMCLLHFPKPPDFRLLFDEILIVVSSQCFGPPMVETRLGISPESTVLFKL